MKIPQPSLLPVSDFGDARYELERDYAYRWFADNGEWLVRIPAGFRTDGASVPWIGTVLTGITRDGLHRAAALVHDWLYRHGGKLPPGSFQQYRGGPNQWVNVPVAWTREQTDKFFAVMLRESGVVRWRRRVMYLAVRAVGWRSWKSPKP